MKIGFNIKKLYYQIMTELSRAIGNLQYSINNNSSDIETMQGRITTLEGSIENLPTDYDWLEITASNGQEAEITRPFSEIRMLARVGSNGNNYCVTIPYDSIIFHNSTTGGNKYFICGNPTANKYGCKFKYRITSNGKQYVCVDSCFDGGSNEASEFKAWIKVDNTAQ